jgi:hypothetical protein
VGPFSFVKIGGGGPRLVYQKQIPALIQGFSNYFEIGIDEAAKIITSKIDGLEGITMEEISKVAPLSLIQAETRQAVNQLSRTSIYLGLETVHIVGKMEVNPQDIEEILKIGAVNKVHGYVLSWDLLNTPITNMLPLKSLN